MFWARYAIDARWWIVRAVRTITCTDTWSFPNTFSVLVEYGFAGAGEEHQVLALLMRQDKLAQAQTQIVG